MPLKFRESLHPFGIVDYPEEDIEEIVEEEKEIHFDPEAGKASDDPFAHLKLEGAPEESAASGEEVSKYVTGEEE